MSLLLSEEGAFDNPHQDITSQVLPTKRGIGLTANARA